MRGERGSITVMSSIIFLVLVLLVGTVIDATRMNLGYSKAYRAVQSSTASLLGNFETNLKDEYGLFALKADESNMSEEIKSYTNNMLNPLASLPDSRKTLFDDVVKDVFTLAEITTNKSTLPTDPNVWSMWNYKVSTPVVHAHKMTTDVVRLQILEYMKYRAPIQFIEPFLRKLDTVLKASNSAAVIDSKVKLDKELSALEDVYSELRRLIDGWSFIDGVFNHTVASESTKFLKSFRFSGSETLDSIEDEKDWIKYIYNTDLRLGNSFKLKVLTSISNDNIVTLIEKAYNLLDKAIENQMMLSLSETLLSEYSSHIKNNDGWNRFFENQITKYSNVNYQWVYVSDYTETLTFDGKPLKIDNTVNIPKARSITSSDISRYKNYVNNVIANQNNSDPFFQLALLYGEDSQSLGDIAGSTLAGITKRDAVNLIFNDAYKSHNLNNIFTDSMNDITKTVEDLNQYLSDLEAKENIPEDYKVLVTYDNPQYIPATEKKPAVGEKYITDEKLVKYTFQSSNLNLNTINSTFENTVNKLDKISYNNEYNLRVEAAYNEFESINGLGSDTASGSTVISQLQTYLNLIGEIDKLFQEIDDKKSEIETCIENVETNLKDKDAILQDTVVVAQLSIDTAKDRVGISNNDLVGYTELLKEKVYSNHEQMTLLKEHFSSEEYTRKSILESIQVYTSDSDNDERESTYLKYLMGQSLLELVFAYTKSKEDIHEPYIENSDKKIKKIVINMNISKFYDTELEPRPEVYEESSVNEQKAIETEKLDNIKEEATSGADTFIENSASGIDGALGIVQNIYKLSDGPDLPSYTLSNDTDNEFEGDKKVNVSFKDDGDGGAEESLGFLTAIGKRFKDFGVDFRNKLYENEYILNTFKNKYSMHFNRMDSSGAYLVDKNTVLNNEVEYIINGKIKDSQIQDTSNYTIIVAKIFTIRLALNFIHVMSDPLKRSTTFSIASALAGWWTAGLGIPVFQVLISAVWAALESSVDILMLETGGSVAFYKLSGDWYTSATGGFSNLLKKAIEKISMTGIDFAMQQINSIVVKGADAVKEKLKTSLESATTAVRAVIPDKDELKEFANYAEKQVGSYVADISHVATNSLSLLRDNLNHIIELKLYMKYEPNEDLLREYQSVVDQYADELRDEFTFDEINSLLLGVDKEIISIDLENLTSNEKNEGYISSYIAKEGEKIINEINEKLDSKLNEITEKLSKKVEDNIDRYTEELVGLIEKNLTDASDKMTEKAVRYVKNDIFKHREKATGKSSINLSKTTDKVTEVEMKVASIRFNYEDYLRLFLLLMTSDNKIARTMDVMQINISDKKDGFEMLDYAYSFDTEVEIEIESVFSAITFFPGITEEAIDKYSIKGRSFMFNFQESY